MKKITKRILCLALAVVMLLGISVFAFAAKTNDGKTVGSITVKNEPAKSGYSIEGITYRAYRVFDISYSSDENPEFFTYVPTAFFKPFFDDANNARFAVDKLELSYDNSSFMNEFTTALGAFCILNVNGSTEVYTGVGTVKDGDGIETCEITSPNAPPLGYYLIAADLDSLSHNDAQKTKLLGLDTTTPDVVIQTKPVLLTEEDFDKTIKNDLNVWAEYTDRQIGDTVEYKIVSRVPEHVREYYEFNYEISDTFSKGLKMNFTSVDIQAGYRKTGTTDELTMLPTKFVDASIANAAMHNPPTNSMTFGKLTGLGEVAVLDENGRAVLDGDGNPVKEVLGDVNSEGFVFKASKGPLMNAFSMAQSDYLAKNPELAADFEVTDLETYFVVTYTAELTSKALIYELDEQGNPNKAKLKYSNNPHELASYKTLEDETEVFTFGVELFKFYADKNNNLTKTRLAGATFEILDENGNKLTFFRDTDIVEGLYTKEVYTLADSLKKADVAVEKRTQFTTTTNEILIKGFDTTKKYTLSEVVVPDGFYLNGSGKVDFTIVPTYENNTVKTLTYRYKLNENDESKYTTTENGNIIPVENLYTKQLPGTGGIGGALVIGVGLLAALGGGTVLLLNRKKKEDEE
ncbi:isopeptide-forming domain-containing fimbrial protein [Clostridiaceae bacterium OttesenSCG-928-D20]|nr:isopeptide-forming domain-containing fimbrial protein [Clostridiaceae bacterium OttesenSCG-928-D20]